MPACIPESLPWHMGETAGKETAPPPPTRYFGAVAVMPVIRQPISTSQLAEFLGVDPERFITIQKCGTASGGGFEIILEPDDANLEHLSTTERQHRAETQGQG